jgi:hypothetical protein
MDRTHSTDEPTRRDCHCDPTTISSSSHRLAPAIAVKPRLRPSGKYQLPSSLLAAWKMENPACLFCLACHSVPPPTYEAGGVWHENNYYSLTYIPNDPPFSPTALLTKCQLPVTSCQLPVPVPPTALTTHPPTHRHNMTPPPMTRLASPHPPRTYAPNHPPGVLTS